MQTNENMKVTRNEKSINGFSEAGGVYEKQGTGNRDEGIWNTDWRLVNMDSLCAYGS
jgi:hypothetical protein